MPRLTFSPVVQTALELKKPVVALESTVITHGLPYPQNLETAKALEAEVQNSGAIPATIAVLDGNIHIGCDSKQLERLAQEKMEKVSLWNLPAIIAKGASAGTTVATTAHLAHLAGIEVFATGGIGGVHFDAFDESADLPALARIPIVVVCAGAKSILNLHATIERLETLGIPVIGYRTDSLPAFHTPTSPHSVAARLDTPQEIAKAHRAARDLEMRQSILVANPIPEGIAFERVQKWVEAANHEARKQMISGKRLTPFLLSELARLSSGETVRVNSTLLLNNASLGGKSLRH
ncbi:MAG: pseudouridine-5'-phosphate glycosidase [Deinococcales bacterium]